MKILARAPETAKCNTFKRAYLVLFALHERHRVIRVIHEKSLLCKLFFFGHEGGGYIWLSACSHDAAFFKNSDCTSVTGFVNVFTYD